MFRKGKIIKNTGYEIINGIGDVTFNFHGNKNIILKNGDLKIVNHIFYDDNGYIRLIPLMENWFKDKCIEGYDCKKVQYFDENYYSRYYNMGIKPKIDSIFLKDTYNDVLHLLLIYSFVKLLRFTVNDFTPVASQYTNEENIMKHLSIFNRFLDDFSNTSFKFLKLSDTISVNSLLVFDGLPLTERNYLYWPKKFQLPLPKYNFTTLFLLYNTYKLANSVFVTSDDPDKNMVITPNTYEYDNYYTGKFSSLFKNTENLVDYETFMALLVKELKNAKSIYKDMDDSKLVSQKYHVPTGQNRIFYTDIGELVVGSILFGSLRGVVIMRKYVNNGNVYLKLIKEYSTVYPTNEEDNSKKVRMRIGRFMEFVNKYSRGYVGFYYDDMEGVITIIHVPYRDLKTVYFTDVDIKEHKIGIKNGYLYVDKMKIKIMDTYGYVYEYL